MRYVASKYFNCFTFVLVIDRNNLTTQHACAHHRTLCNVPRNAYTLEYVHRVKHFGA
jgi:hypothetical protein